MLPLDIGYFFPAIKLKSVVNFPKEKQTMAFGNKKFELSPRLKLGVGRGYSQNQILKLAAIACLVLALILAGNAVRLLFKQSPKGPQSQVLGASTTKQP